MASDVGVISRKKNCTKQTVSYKRILFRNEMDSEVFFVKKKDVGSCNFYVIRVVLFSSAFMNLTRFEIWKRAMVLASKLGNSRK